MKGRPWVGVDLDGTLAHYDGWQGELHVGAPVPLMVMRVHLARSRGYDVRVFTARVAEPDPELRAQIVARIQAWCLDHLGEVLEVTNVKDYEMVELWDDRAVQVVPNTGEFVGRSMRGFG